MEGGGLWWDVQANPYIPGTPPPNNSPATTAFQVSHASDGGMADAFVAKFSFTAAVNGNNVSITAGSQANDGNPDLFQIVRGGSQTWIYVNGLLAYNAPTASIDAVYVYGSNDVD